MKKILFINSCVREESRTRRLANHLLAHLEGEIEEVVLSELGLKVLDNEKLAKRTDLISAGDYSDPMFDLAKQFAAADIIVMAAPYWDLSFPAILKLYIENIYVTGIVSKYGPDGMPVGMCSAEKLYYVTTCGGPYEPEYSYGYIERMANAFFGIKNTFLIKAEMLDVEGFDSETIVNEAMNNIDKMFAQERILA